MVFDNVTDLCAELLLVPVKDNAVIEIIKAEENKQSKYDKYSGDFKDTSVIFHAQ
jgi:hypothetical protein